MRRNNYEIVAVLIGVLTFLAVNAAKFTISETSVQGLLTFLSIAFGFYVSAIATLFSSQFVKSLHQQIDARLGERGTHSLARHFRFYFLTAAFSIAVILMLTSTATVLNGGRLDFPFAALVLWQSKTLTLSLNSVAEGIICGLAIVNFYYTVVLANSVLSALVVEASKK
jgi:hypothetical protein